MITLRTKHLQRWFYYYEDVTVSTDCKPFVIMKGAGGGGFGEEVWR
jgi:hypothetical protein